MRLKLNNQNSWSFYTHIKLQRKKIKEDKSFNDIKGKTLDSLNEFNGIHGEDSGRKIFLKCPKLAEWSMYGVY